MFANPTKYDRKYATITLTPYGWVSISVQLNENTHIKHNHNNNIIDNYVNALNVISVLYQTNYNTICKHATFQSLVDNKLNTFNVDKNHLYDLHDIYKLTNNIMTQYIIERLFTDTTHTIIDILPNGLSVTGDEIQSISFINSIYLISLNESIITEYTQSMLNKKAKHHLFMQLDKSKNKLIDKFVNMNIIKSNFDNYTSLKNKMLSIPDYKLKCIDTIFVQNSVEIFSSIINLLTFLKFSSEVLSPRGNIITKNYDIDDINIMCNETLNINTSDSTQHTSKHKRTQRVSFNQQISKNVHKHSQILKHVKVLTINDIQQRCINETIAINEIYLSKHASDKNNIFKQLTSLNIDEVDFHYDIAIYGLLVIPDIYKHQHQL